MRVAFVNLPGKIRDYFRLFHEKVVDVLTDKLKKVFEQDQFQQFNSHEFFLSSSEHIYEDDSNTKCAGTCYRGFWVVPILRPLLADIHEEYQNYYHGAGRCALYFSCVIKVRDRDLKTQWASSEIVVAGFSIDQKCQERIALNTNGIMTVQRSTVFEAAKRIIQIQQDLNLWNSIPDFKPE